MHTIGLFVSMLLWYCGATTTVQDYQLNKQRNDQASVKGNQVIIKRHHYGVPHVYANCVYKLFLGYHMISSIVSFV